MSIYDFVLNLWLNSDNCGEYMDIETATKDVERFKGEAANDDAFIVPEDITPESYMETWNEFVKQFHKDNE